jgi:hypothetical protein
MLASANTFSIWQSDGLYQAQRHPDSSILVLTKIRGKVGK